MAATDIQAVWSACVTDLQSRLSTPSSRAWFEETEPVALSADVITLRAPNSFAKEWLEQRYGNLLTDALRRASGRDLRVEILTAPAAGARRPDAGRPCWSSSARNRSSRSN